MKLLNILIDTNIILDWLLKRDDLFYASEKCLCHCKEGKIRGFITPHSISDIFYVVHKKFNAEERRELLILLLSFLSVLPENEDTFMYVLENESDTWTDIEDSLQMSAAKLCDMDFIVTRNLSDFKDSDVCAISPEKFLELES